MIVEVNHTSDELFHLHVTYHSVVLNEVRNSNIQHPAGMHLEPTDRHSVSMHPATLGAGLVPSNPLPHDVV